ncbi:MAG: pitrilysin family protein [bacterium]|nr:pitrilysin family protein [bacterium]
MQAKVKKLRNNLSLMTVNLPAFKSVTILVFVATGSRYEIKRTNGIAHFAEHMFFKGTKKRPTAADISATIDGIGGEFNAFTSKEYTGYYVKGSSQHLDLIMDVLSDMLLNSKFEQKEIDKERGVIGEELRMYLDQPMRYVAEIYEELLYGDQPLGWDTVGTLESLTNINRDQFLGYLDDYYHPNNMLVVIAGDITEEKAEALTDKYFGSLQDKETKKFLPAKFSQAQPAVRLFEKDTEQAHFCLGVRSLPLGNPDRYKISVLNTVLGAGMSSRLFLEVRERRGLAYYVRGSVDEYLDAGAVTFQAGVEPKKIEEAIKVVLAELNKIAEKGLSSVELNKAKEYMKGKLVLGLEDSRDVAMMFGLEQLLEKKTRTPENIASEIDKVREEDVQEMAKNLFKNEGLNLAVIGPFKDQENFASITKL